MQCRFTFSPGKKDYHLLFRKVESRPPSHSSAGMWKQWGKLNSRAVQVLWLSLLHVCKSEMIIPKASVTSKVLAAVAPVDCSET